MRKFMLSRVSYTQRGTFGVLLGENSIPVCVTLENPWEDNTPTISCIPVGLYKCNRRVSPKFGESFEVTDVPGRTHIIFHKGNTEFDTSGCILLATRFGHIGDIPAILDSATAYNAWMLYLFGEDSFELAIVDSTG